MPVPPSWFEIKRGGAKPSVRTELSYWIAGKLSSKKNCTLKLRMSRKIYDLRSPIYNRAQVFNLPYMDAQLQSPSRNRAQDKILPYKRRWPVLPDSLLVAKGDYRIHSEGAARRDPACQHRNARHEAR